MKRRGLIGVKDVKNRLLVNALLDPLATGEAETITLTVEERAKLMRLNVKSNEYPKATYDTTMRDNQSTSTSKLHNH